MIENIIAQYVDILRRSGDFERVISEFTDRKFNDETIQAVVNFQIELAKNKDAGVYTVRDALKEADIPYVIVYPDLEKCYKHEYIVLRIYRRERTYEGLTETLSKNWKKWIKEINDDEYGIKLTINHNTYLDDLISDIIHAYNNHMRGKFL